MWGQLVFVTVQDTCKPGDGTRADGGCLFTPVDTDCDDQVRDVYDFMHDDLAV